MTTTVDLAALAAAGQSRVTLLGGTITSLGSTGTDYAGFDDASAVYVEVQVQLRDSRRGAPSLTLLLQGSDDGNSWSTLETFTFTNNGTQTATVDTPNAHLRVSWTVASNTEWYIDHVTVAPASLNAPGGGGGSQPVTLTLTAAEIAARWSVSVGGAYVEWTAITTDSRVLSFFVRANTLDQNVVSAQALYAYLTGADSDAVDAGSSSFVDIVVEETSDTYEARAKLPPTNVADGLADGAFVARILDGSGAYAFLSGDAAPTTGAITLELIVL